MLSNTAVLALRFGRTEFPDNDTLTIDFDPRSLPFSTTYKDQIRNLENRDLSLAAARA